MYFRKIDASVQAIELVHAGELSRETVIARVVLLDELERSRVQSSVLHVGGLVDGGACFVHC